MSEPLFRASPFNVRQLVDNIKRGDIALPDIQRPFVWPNRKVRDLFDSMVKGFPVGYLLFWETGSDGGVRQIGVDHKHERVARWLIVDGQQRLTSLFSVMTGTTVVREDYSESRIRLAFRPQDCSFEVTDAAIEKNPEYLPDITPLFDDYRNTVRGYIKRLEEAREELSESDKDFLDEQFDRVRDVGAYPFQVIELDAAMDEEQVADVFVRVNSEGVPLNQADFILTLMSVFRDKARRELEDFSRAAKQPSISRASPFNWYLQPQPDQLLRVSIALAFRRAVLKHAYTLLRGRSLETGEFSAELREIQFDRLQKSQDHVLNLLHWHEFLQCIERAGFRSSKMIAGSNAVLYTYALWLIGRIDYGVPIDKLREVIARWFFMAHTTARYSGSFESTFESDMARLNEVKPGDGKGFIDVLDRVIEDRLTSDYWSISLPNELGTSAAKSPSLMAYIAALNILDADVLLSTTKVRSRLDPAIALKKGIERHHLFPKGHLKKLGISDVKKVNQIANFAMVEWSDNIKISDGSPSDYWPTNIAEKKIEASRLAKQVELHALPDRWETLEFEAFLEKRRKLMAEVVRQAYEVLKSDSYVPPATERVSVTGEEIQGEVGLTEMLEEGHIFPGVELVANTENGELLASVLPNGKIYFDEGTYSSLLELSSAAALTGSPWNDWYANLADGRVRLAVLRDQLDNRDRQ